MSTSDRLDRFLEEHALVPSEKPIRCDPTRPKTPGINAIRCASCGQAEYLTRDYCRCGHYLRGQLEDEFLAWEGQIAEEHNRLAETLDLKLKKVRYFSLLGLPFIAVPLLFWALPSESLSLTPLVWVAIGIGIMGVCAVVEHRLRKPVGLSQHFIATYTIETFLEQRAFRMLEE